jgi:hypothetical protein
MKCDHDGYSIECFEIGRGLWHARIQRADLKPVILDGVLLPALEVGFAWSNPDDAVAHARTQIDHFKNRFATAASVPQVEHSAAH